MDLIQRLREKNTGTIINREKDAIARKYLPKFKTFFTHQRNVFLREFDSYKDLFPERASRSPLASKLIEADRQLTLTDFDSAWSQTELETTLELQGIILAEEFESMEAGSEIAKSFFSKEVGGSFDLANPRAVAWYSQHGGSLDYIKDIQATSKNQLQTIITKSLDEGWSYNKTSQVIREKFTDFSRYRAQLIATHEAAQAYEAGNRIFIEGLSDMGVNMEKMWNNSGDEKVSDGCIQNTNDGWIPLDREHSSGHQNPPRFPSCRCFETYRKIAEQVKKAVNQINNVPSKIEGITGTQVRVQAQNIFNKTNDEIKEINVIRGELSAQIKAETAKLQIYTKELIDKGIDKSEIISLTQVMYDENIKHLTEKTIALYNRKEIIEKSITSNIHNLIYESERAGIKYTVPKNSVFYKVNKENADAAFDFLDRVIVSDTLEKNVIITPLRTGSRANYDIIAKKLNLAPGDKTQTIIHEFGHLLEDTNPEIKAKVYEFYERRTAGEGLQKMSVVTGNKKYRAVEKTRVDNFMDPYIGKDYTKWSSTLQDQERYATEVSSMALEFLYTDPAMLLIKDPEMFELIIDVIKGNV